MKKNLILGAAISAALLAGNAQAAITVDAHNFPVFTAANTRVVYLSGASAATTFIEKVLTGASLVADRICDTAQPIWKFKDNIDGATQNAYLCTQATASTNLTLPTDKPNLLIYKRNEGGSGYGVSPLIAEANGHPADAAIEFLKIDPLTTCTAALNPAPVVGSLTNITCSYTSGAAGVNQLVAPDFGISDVDPAQFTGVNAPFKTDNVTVFPNVTTADVNKLTVHPGAGVVFGVPVTKHLYNALQAAQKAEGKLAGTCVVGASNVDACMPSLSKQQISTLVKGDWASWNNIKVVVGATSTGLLDWATANLAADAAGADVVHICRRENGSGTQAQLNNFALNYPCTATSSNTIPKGANDVTALGPVDGYGEADGSSLVHENSTAGRVTACLSDLNQGVDAAGDGFANIYADGAPRWAIGAQSLEKSNANFEFVKINGVAPTLANVANGSYLDWFENTFQYNTNHAKFLTDAKLKQTIDSIIKAATVPEVMASINTPLVHAFGTGSYLASPKNNTPTLDGILNIAKPINVYSHQPDATVSLNNCTAPVAYQATPAGL